jgi:hypothetical protein
MSWLKRFLYLIMIVSGGGGGWLAKDFPQVQGVVALLTGKPPIGDSSSDNPLASTVVKLLKPVDDFSQSGTFTVTIDKVHLDPKLFRLGRTVDIQARVVKLDGQGRSTTLWETKPYGERLATVGRDDLSAGWPQLPFPVEWNQGESLSVEVYDRHGLFGILDSAKFVLAPPNAEPSEFPLKPGTFPLQPVEQPETPIDPRNNTIVLESQRVGELPNRKNAEPAPRRPSLTRSLIPDSDSPIIIK